MPRSVVRDIVDMAVSKDTFDLLLLGKAEYRCFSLDSAMRSGNPYDNDLGEVLDELYRYARRNPEENIGERLLAGMMKIVDTYEGLTALAQGILFEAFAMSRVDDFGQSKPNRGLGFPLDGIAEELKRSIQVFSSRLMNDRAGVGEEWPDGVLGDLRRLSRNTESVGGPRFCD